MGIIDADDLIAQLIKHNATEKMTVAHFTSMVIDATTFDAVPVVHGRWIDIDSEMYTWKIRCSKCGHERSVLSIRPMYPRYCEDCGARMDGKEDEQHGE